MNESFSEKLGKVVIGALAVIWVLSQLLEGMRFMWAD